MAPKAALLLTFLMNSSREHILGRFSLAKNAHNQLVVSLSTYFTPSGGSGAFVSTFSLNTRCCPKGVVSVMAMVVTFVMVSHGFERSLTTPLTSELAEPVGFTS